MISCDEPSPAQEHKTPADILVVVYETRDLVPAEHRFVAYFYWPNGTLASVPFRGATAEAVRSAAGAFAVAQLEKDAETIARNAAAAAQRALARAAKASRKDGASPLPGGPL